MTPLGANTNASVVAPFFAHPNALVVSTTSNEFTHQQSRGHLKVLFSSGVFGEFVASSSTTIQQIFAKTPDFEFCAPPPKDSLVLGTQTVIVDALFRSGASLALCDLEWLVAHFGTLELTART
jgi:hypothetical protein